MHLTGRSEALQATQLDGVLLGKVLKIGMLPHVGHIQTESDDIWGKAFKLSSAGWIAAL